ncbi:hypothetical protein PIB30_041200 [Stylosanthes scabra]|uniref:Uncharacterized protein n=1 Tax=Stylosanthes scabra TaxID=79078 RepID=A0ABU6ZDI4_9FABA|nr:hypothetical protein [Stylosanthes scabra]
MRLTGHWLTLTSELRAQTSPYIRPPPVPHSRPLRSASASSPCRRVVSPPSSRHLLRRHRASANLVSAFAVIPCFCLCLPRRASSYDW